MVLDTARSRLELIDVVEVAAVDLLTKFRRELHQWKMR